MKHAHVYLPDDQWKQLATLSRQQATPVTELIRRAIAQVYPVRRRTRFEQALDAVTGMWQDRQDWGSTESYVRTLRLDDRPTFYFLLFAFYLILALPLLIRVPTVHIVHHDHREIFDLQPL